MTNVLNFALRKIQTQKHEDTEKTKTLQLGDFAFINKKQLGNHQNRKTLLCYTTKSEKQE